MSKHIPSVMAVNGNFQSLLHHMESEVSIPGDKLKPKSCSERVIEASSFLEEIPPFSKEMLTDILL